MASDAHSSQRIVIAGGGAAGYFAAITCAEACGAAGTRADVVLLEASAHPLAKVKISGGGRCNVTRACFDPRELIKGYPRGSRELLGAFHRWQPRDTIEWFETRGVPLITQPDLRMFPKADTSQAIIDCLQHAATRAGVHVRTHCGLADAEVAETQTPRFALTLTTGETLPCDHLLLATGGSKGAAAHAVAAKFGHTIETPVPSLFTFNIDDERLKDLAGFAVPSAVTHIPGTKLRETGPMIITHWGLSGPAVLKISAWGARELHERNYHFPLVVNWVGAANGEHPGVNTDQARAALNATRTTNARQHITTWNPFGLSQRLWERLVRATGIPPDSIWANASNATLAAIATQVTACEFSVTGKSTNKDEFVTCGGVRLSEVDFKTMQSRARPGLYFAGEVLDIDGITGGYNFQAAWTTGRIAGLAVAEHAALSKS